MKISVSLSDVDVDFLDGYASTQGLGTRSAAVREAVQLLRTAELGDDYANAWAEWERDPASEAWESTASDGLPPRNDPASIRHPARRLEPSVGSEAGKVRPAVVVSNNRANATAARLERGVVTVVPMTSNVERVYLFQVLLGADVCGIPLDSKAQAEQLRSLSVVQVGALVGRVPDQLMAELDRALRLHLAL